MLRDLRNFFFWDTRDVAQEQPSLPILQLSQTSLWTSSLTLTDPFTVVNSNRTSLGVFPIKGDGKVTITPIMEANSQSSVTIGQESDEESLAIASNTSSNMRNYFQRATGAMSLQQGCEAVVVNAAPIAQSGIFDNRVPLNLLPYQ